ncbi:MAG: hypothetical protein BYD32DRAFT_413722 [Podila humilis]|nr:MAG: hypothetical protein BYD32DRAFT_413722 [Podila humilis]
MKLIINMIFTFVDYGWMGYIVHLLNDFLDRLMRSQSIPLHVGPLFFLAQCCINKQVQPRPPAVQP